MKKNINEMLEANSDIRIITERDMAHLPPSVHQYLIFAGILHKEKIKTVRLKQGGDFRLKPQAKFRQMKAIQYFNVDSGDFYWQGKINVITATDKFINGKGNLKIKLFGFIKLAEAEGFEVDQGEVLRLLAEGVWFPSVYINSYISWKEIDDSTAVATIEINGIKDSATFHFAPDHSVQKITAKRFMEKNGTFQLEDWEIKIKEYKEFNGINIPVKSEVIWKLQEGDFCWYKPEIYAIEYNVISPF